MASVRKRVWVHKGEPKTAWVVDYRDADGKRRLETFAKKRDADAFVQRSTVEMHSGTHVAKSRAVTVKRLCADYVTSLENKKTDGGTLSNAYLSSIASGIRSAINPSIGHVPTTELSVADVESMVDFMRGKGVGPITVRMRLKTLMRVLEFGIRRGCCGKNPARVVLKDLGHVPSSKIKQFTKEQIDSLLEFSAVRGYGQREGVAQRTDLYVNLAAFCALRYGEISALNLDAFDFDAGIVRVTRALGTGGEMKGPKSRSGVRSVPMPPHVAAMVLRWIAAFKDSFHEGFLFAKPSAIAGRFAELARSDYEAWSRLLVRAGLCGAEDKQKPHFHALRHFAISWWLSRGMPVVDAAKLAGHSKIDITLQVYAHSLAAECDHIARIREMTEQFFALKNLPDAAPARALVATQMQQQGKTPQ